MSHSLQLLNWYFEHQRRLPWRETSDPYKIWVSEVMLQQTQVDTVIDYFNRFMEAFPSISHLANAQEPQVLKLWEGLGYYTRARKLLSCAREIVLNHNGRFPEEFESVLKLPGIGPYTAGAVMSIAFNQAYPAVDGNVMRVYSRLYNLYDDISLPKTRKSIEQLVIANLPQDRRHYNQALMELGAMVCRPKDPLCGHCPVSLCCMSLEAGTQLELPVKAKKPQKRIIRMAVAYVRRGEDLFIVKREEPGLLHGLWGLPMTEFDDMEEAQTMLRTHMADTYQVLLEEGAYRGMKKHVFTHLVWEMHLFAYKLDFADALYENRAAETEGIYADPTHWMPHDSLKTLAFPTAIHKLFQIIQDV